MPQEEQTNQTVKDATAAALDAANASQPSVPAGNALSEIAGKISEANNILVALSSSPSVDELAAAIGLSLYLDHLGKRATAIYSGTTPNALEFLKPEETFSQTADALQDFVIALNKDKADHLRYKLDGDYVKIYITPYRSRIDKEDLEFSYGDFNVDLVLALDVANGIDLDAALREHGRIMHDAVIINITTGKPGKFGEIEWSDKTASSVSEMIATLLYSAGNKDLIEKEEATAFLTGIVAATNRFANGRTTPATMRLTSRLMESGANQQLVAKNISPDMDNELIGFGQITSKVADDPKPLVETDPTRLSIGHEGDIIPGDDPSKEVLGDLDKESSLLADLKAAEASLSMAGAETTPEIKDEPVKIDNEVVSEPTPVETNGIVSAPTPVDTVMAAESEPVLESENAPNADEQIIIEGPAVAPVQMDEPVMPILEPYTPIAEEPAPAPETEPIAEPAVEPVAETAEPIAEPAVVAEEPVVEPAPVETPVETPAEPSAEPETPAAEEGMAQTDPANNEIGIIDKPEKVIQPLGDFGTAPLESETNKYGQMLEAALAEDANVNPAMLSTPVTPTAPEINGVPEMNFMPMPGDETLPPPPTPPIDMNALPTVAPTMPTMPTMETVTAPAPAAPVAQATPVMPTVTPIQAAAPTPTPTLQSLGNQPAMQDQVYNTPVDPGAFRIPGM